MDLQIKIISQNSESKYKTGNKYLKRKVMQMEVKGKMQSLYQVQ